MASTVLLIRKPVIYVFFFSKPVRYYCHYLYSVRIRSIFSGIQFRYYFFFYLLIVLSTLNMEQTINNLEHHGLKIKISYIRY